MEKRQECKGVSLSSKLSLDFRIMLPFSSRFQSELSPNSLFTLLEHKKKDGDTIIDLTESNPTKVGFSYPASLLDHLSVAENYSYEPHPRGMPRAREAVAAYYASQSISIEPEHIHLTASTSEAYSFLLKLLTNPGDEILVPRPGYPLAEHLAALEFVNVAYYDYRYDPSSGWSIDLLSMEANIHDRTRAIVLVHPNNPTGSYLSATEKWNLLALCAGKNLQLIVDEVFFDYRLNDEIICESFLRSASDATVFVLNGFSKMLALPQMKLGWIATHCREDARSMILPRLDLIADTYLSVSTPVQHAAKTFFSFREQIQSQIIARIRDNLAFLTEAFGKRNDATLARVDGGWNAIIELATAIEEEAFAYRLLEESNVLVHPGYFYECRQGRRVILSLITQKNIFQKGVKKIAEALQN